MAKKLMSFKTKGMNQDLSVSAFNPEFSFENMNLRLSTNDNNTLLSWVNERGTKLVDGIDWDLKSASFDGFIGIPVGTAVIDHKLIVFTHDTENGIDYIYKVTESLGEFHNQLIYRGNLNLSTKNPLETLVYFEADNIQKVYWVDGRNQPRLLNVIGLNRDRGTIREIDSIFDFSPTFRLPEDFSIEKGFSTGSFAPGVIQYCFTYNYRYGALTNIVQVSPIWYISPKTRGEAPDGKVSNTFTITVKDVDPLFDFVRIYSIHRTSINSVPVVKRLIDLDIPKDLEEDEELLLTYTDNGTTGDTIDPSSLLYIGGKDIIAGTMVSKDDTLFLGDITLKNVVTPIKNPAIPGIAFSYYSNSNIAYAYQYASTIYYNEHTLNKNQSDITTFKGGEWYRFGIQLQRKNGEWTDPIYLLDAMNPLYPLATPEGVQLVQASLTLPLASVILDNILDYIAVRPLVVYPTITDRSVICLGVLNPTVFNAKDRYDKSVYAQASWFFRPYTPSIDSRYTSYSATRPNSPELNIKIPWESRPLKGAALTFEHYAPLPALWTYFPNSSQNFDEVEHLDFSKEEKIEIQGSYNDWPKITDPAPEVILSNTEFFVDLSIVTLNSPDIEFDTEVQNLGLDNLKLRVIGYIPISSYASSHSIIASTSLPRNQGSEDTNAEGAAILEPPGSGETPYNITHYVSDPYAAHRLIAAPLWNDVSVTRDYSINSEEEGEDKARVTTSSYTLDFTVYPWLRTGPLNDDSASKDEASSWLQTKKISHLLWSSHALYFDPLHDFTNFDKISVGIHLWENEYVHPIKLSYKLTPEGKNFIIDYYPNIDKVFYNKAGYRIVAGAYSEVNDSYSWTGHIGKVVSPVSMRYKSGSHAVISLGSNLLPYYKSTTGQANIGKAKISEGKLLGDDASPFKFTTLSFYETDTLHDDSLWDNPRLAAADHLSFLDAFSYNPDLIPYSWLWLGELYRDESSGQNNPYTGVPNRFGGSSPEAIKLNIWTIGGPIVNILSVYGEGEEESSTGIVDLVWDCGDTYYQRYDCLKTYAFTPEDTNQNIEILSFMCETRVNIDGRYDKNRGLLDNTNMHPKNFNFVNPVYSQRDSYFLYNNTGRDMRYPNWLTYTQTKHSGTDTDEWTHLTLGATLELDGDKGEIRALRKLNNSIFAFQDRGIALILYNENAAIATTDGVPIELANSGKVLGKRYISDTVGCLNKWSITNTPAGLYFIDSINKDIYLFNGQLNNLTVSKGFSAWAKKNIAEGIWDPNSFNSHVTYYDPINQDVLFIDNSTALAYSEKLGTFTSFYNYGGAPYFCMLDSSALWISRDNYRNTEQYTEEDKDIWLDYDPNLFKLYLHLKGGFCNFFGVNYPYWTILVGNQEPLTDKIFTNMEFRACVDGEGVSTTIAINSKPVQVYNPYLPFDYLEAWNEYQHGIIELENKHGRDLSKHHESKKDEERLETASLKRKFRIWRCDLPRDNMEYIGPFADTFQNTFDISQYRKKPPKDRLRNPWVYIKLQKKAATGSHLEKKEVLNELPNGTYILEQLSELVRNTLPRAEIHDFIMTYYN